MKSKCNSIFFVIFLVFSFLIFGCDLKTDALEYVNEEVSYADGESCVERYLFYEEDETYERYIAGKYFGQDVPGTYFGTLFESGVYKASATSSRVSFSPKKQYDFETQRLEFLGLQGQVPYSGTLTDKTLTIPWRVRGGTVSIIYKRK